MIQNILTWQDFVENRWNNYFLIFDQLFIFFFFFLIFLNQSGAKNVIQLIKKSLTSQKIRFQPDSF